MDHARARQTMVENQLRPSQIDDPAVLAAMGAVPRERFVEPALAGVAYADDDLRLADGGWLIEPLTMARLLQHALIGHDDQVMVIGCATGYAAALAARLAANVIQQQTDPAAVAPVKALLAELGVHNVVVCPAPEPAAGHPSLAPFDVILLVGAVPEVPQTLQDQLAEGGRLLAVVARGRVGRVTLVSRVHGVLGQRTLFDAQVPAIPGFAAAAAFAF